MKHIWLISKGMHIYLLSRCMHVLKLVNAVSLVGE